VVRTYHLRDRQEGRVAAPARTASGREGVNPMPMLKRGLLALSVRLPPVVARRDCWPHRTLPGTLVIAIARRAQAERAFGVVPLGATSLTFVMSTVDHPRLPGHALARRRRPASVGHRVGSREVRRTGHGWWIILASGLPVSPWPGPRTRGGPGIRFRATSRRSGCRILPSSKAAALVRTLQATALSLTGNPCSHRKPRVWDRHE
jgi:hypothetical protein